MTLAYLFFGLFISRLDCSHENCWPGSIDYKTRHTRHKLHNPANIRHISCNSQKYQHTSQKCVDAIHYAWGNMFFIVYPEAGVSRVCVISPRILERILGCHWLSSSRCVLGVRRWILEGGWSCLSITTSHKDQWSLYRI